MCSGEAECLSVQSLSECVDACGCRVSCFWMSEILSYLSE